MTELTYPAHNRPSQTEEQQVGQPEATKEKRGIAAFSVWLGRAAFVVTVLGVWKLAGSSGFMDERFIGSPDGTVLRLKDMLASGALVDPTVATLLATIVSLLIAIPTGILLGLVLAVSRFSDRVVSPFLVPLNSVPRIAFAPLFLLWFGLTIWSKVALAASIVVFVMVFNTRAGVKSVDPDMLAVTRTLGMKKSQVMWKVALPSAVPSIAAGVRLSVTYGILGVVASEMIAAKDGLGLAVVTFSNAFDVNSMLAVLVVLAALATILGLLAEWGERYLLRWE